jgi:hypothetical protein
MPAGARRVPVSRRAVHNEGSGKSRPHALRSVSRWAVHNEGSGKGRPHALRSVSRRAVHNEGSGKSGADASRHRGGGHQRANPTHSFNRIVWRDV